VNFTDADMEKIRLVQKANPDMKLDKLIVYSLLKIYGDNFSNDYNAQYVQSLHRRKEQLSKEIEQLRGILNEKQLDLIELEQEIEQAMEGKE
jgi:hypothetical protein